jgi:hypothetical protein
VTNLQNSSQCTQCTPGMFCYGQGLRAPNGICSNGYYCMGGAASATPTDGVTGNICPAGSYCPAGALWPTPCSAGSYTGFQGNFRTSCFCFAFLDDLFF